MIRKFKITLTRGEESASHAVTYLENELPHSTRVNGFVFLRKDGTPVSFENIHMDQLAAAAKHQAEECGAEGAIEEVTGDREFQISLSGSGFNARYHIIYHPGSEIPMVKALGDNEDIPQAAGTKISFDNVRAVDLKSFVASMAKTNGLNFEFVDLDE